MRCLAISKKEKLTTKTPRQKRGSSAFGETSPSGVPKAADDSAEEYQGIETTDYTDKSYLIN